MARYNQIKKEQLNILKYGYNKRLMNLKKYYSDKGVSIIGLNDFDEEDSLFHKGLIKSLATELSEDDSNVVAIDAFSTALNSTDDINYLLASNPSVADLKELKMYSKIMKLEDQMKQKKLPKFLGKFGYISQALNPINKKDKTAKLTTTLKESTEPIVIYASGLEDLMSDLNSDPFKFHDDYISNLCEYKYTLDKIKSHGSIKKVIGKVENNFKNLLSYNNNISLFAIGAYTHIICYTDAVKLFREVLKEYNYELELLCDKYDFDYIPSYGDLTNAILDCLYDRKIWRPKNIVNSRENIGNHINKEGLYNALCGLKHELKLVCSPENGEPEFAREQKKMVLKKKIEVVENLLLKK